MSQRLMTENQAYDDQWEGLSTKINVGRQDLNEIFKIFWFDYQRSVFQKRNNFKRIINNCNSCTTKNHLERQEHLVTSNSSKNKLVPFYHHHRAAETKFSPLSMNGCYLREGPHTLSAFWELSSIKTSSATCTFDPSLTILENVTSLNSSNKYLTHPTIL